jgi:hypothetical protein
MKMAKKFRLGPNQRRWLKMLETTKLKQTTGMLHKVRGGYCCLGIAELSLGKMPREIHDLALPPQSVSALGLFTNEGAPRWRAGDLQLCTVLNDDEEWSFKKIAAHLRKHARAYFKCAA